MGHDTQESRQEIFEYLCSRLMRSKDALASAESVGYHGTSTESLLEVVRSGALLGGTIENPDATDTQKNSLYFFPKGVSLHCLEDPRRSVKEVHEPLPLIEQAQSYAHTIESQFTLLRSLNLDPKNATDRHVVDCLLYHVEPRDPQELDLYESIHQRFSNLTELIYVAVKRRGAVLALEPRLQTDFDFHPGDPGENDAYILVPPHGLEASYLSGIWFVEPREQEEFFARCQDEFGMKRA